MFSSMLAPELHGESSITQMSSFAGGCHHRAVYTREVECHRLIKCYTDGVTEGRTILNTLYEAGV